ncbi:MULTISPECIES: LysM peptidoglycan-binding domain-containing protein [Dyella]|uniref:LysM peptidoglycan-binding domain-containing protein n=2 Tax=Dyella TaxID=231454 RepID=A0A4R0YX39_9GAMM|nr:MULTISPECIES: substrate-binding domain-containing protein [Dyella]TBR40604.1 LysM peptidoglycan-binding domain-containing protein [Dyella terrae]TCI11814.1 LysM peptidoglycan-binding domain-containing protein [Dyella soli]
MSFRLARILSVALLGVCAATALHADPAPKAKTKKAAAPAVPTLVWRGDVATARGIVIDVAKAYEKAGKGKIEVQPFNTASGLDAVAIGTADFAGSARGADTAAESNLVFTPVAWDALVLITYPSNPVNNLTLKQVHDIYYGKITNWKDVGGRDEPINLYAVASPGDGVEYSFRKLVFGRGNQPVAAPRLYVNTAKLEEAVTLDPKAMGVTTLAGIAGNTKVKLVTINGVPANTGTVTDGSYPLYMPIYLVTNQNNPKGAQIQTFMEFVQSDAVRDIAKKHQLVPFSDAPQLVDMDVERRAKILAEVGSKMTADTTKVSAPGASYAARAAVAPTSELTQQARQSLDARNAESAAKKAEAAGGTHTVAKGETLSTIAKKYSVSVSDLKSWNDLKGDSVKVDQVLKVSPN